MAAWQDEAVRLWCGGGTWAQIAQGVAPLLPGVPLPLVRDRVRSHVRRTDEYKARDKACGIEPGPDGTLISTRFIQLQEGQELEPDEILRLHGLDPVAWCIERLTSNPWNSQTVGGVLQISYQSKLIAKPRIADGITFADVDAYMQGRDWGADKPATVPMQYDADGETLEICLPDLHNGLLAWRMETGEDYDLRIARDRFNAFVGDVVQRCAGRVFKRVLFVTMGDLLHIDTDKQETSKGTFQQSDGRTAKIFGATLGMMRYAVDTFAGIAPLEVIYIPGNHDRVTGYMLMRGLEEVYTQDSNVTFDTVPMPQKQRLIGRALVGWTHGDMPRKNVAGWLQVAARKMCACIQFLELHCGHYHTEKAMERIQTEDTEGVVVRYIPTISGSSTWEAQQGYTGSKAAMCFVWSDVRGLREFWYTSV